MSNPLSMSESAMSTTLLIETDSEPCSLAPSPLSLSPLPQPQQKLSPEMPAVSLAQGHAKPHPLMLFVDDEESSSSEEEYDEDFLLSLAAANTIDSTPRLQLLEIGESNIMRVISTLLAEDLCTLCRVSQYFSKLIQHNQTVWRSLNGYYIRHYGDPIDVNLWDEELALQSQQNFITPSQNNILSLSPVTGLVGNSNKKDSSSKTRSVTFSGKESNRKSVIDTATLLLPTPQVTVIGKRMSGSALKSMVGGTPFNSHVMVLNSTLRRLTPTTSVPPTNDITDFINACHTYPQNLLIRKLIQRYLVPREFSGHYADLVWRKLVEVPIQLRVGKILRKVVDHKQIDFSYPSVLILKTFIKGYILPQTEMARALNNSIDKKLAFNKVFDVSKLSDSLLARIFSNLRDLKSTCACLFVCRRWNNAINSGGVWETLYFNYRRRLVKDDEDDIDIWTGIDPVTYFEHINAALTSLTPGSSKSTTPIRESPSSSVPASPSSSSPATASPTISQLNFASKFSPNLMQTLPRRPPMLSLPRMSISSDVEEIRDNIAAHATADESSVGQSDLTSPRPALPSPQDPAVTTTTTPNNSTPTLEPLITPRLNMNLNQLVEKLTSITTITAVDWKKRVENPIQHNVFKVLKKLIDEHFDDFEGNVVNVLKIFLKHIVVDNTSLSNYLIRSFVKKILKLDSLSTEERNATKGAKSSKIGGLRMMAWKSSMTDILVMPAEDIARQLTLIEFSIYSKIQTSEFLNQSWVKEKTRHLAPNIRAAIDRFNMMTKWVCTVILKEEKIRIRTKYMSKLLKVAKALRSFANYHTLMAILSGLNEAPIFRLKHTFSEMKPKVQKLSSELQALMTVEGNHDAYRCELATIDPKSPCIPYLGVYLKDITFFQEGASGGEGINLKQTKNVYGVLKVIRNFQKNIYSFDENARLHDGLLHLPVLSEDELYALSQSREPRNCKRSDLN
eukprot:gene3446-3915_t